MRWQGRRESNNVEDRRNRPGGPRWVAQAFVFRAEKAASFCWWWCWSQGTMGWI
ncbi:Uncharacterised protein [Salmonella enterica subsp. enterica serovar Typhimurium]|nr:Uncharacterised protein [Salmonella enterica subsp. enterica serovar Typhimurium]